MEVIREIRTVKDGEVTVKLPEGFNETQVEILILPTDWNTGLKDQNTEFNEELIEALKEVKMMREGKLPKKTAREFLSEL